MRLHAKRWNQYLNAIFMDFYDWNYLILDAVERHRHHSLRIVVDDHANRHFHCLDRPTVYCLVNLQVEVVWLAHHSLRLVAQHIVMIGDRKLTSLDNVANEDNRLDTANIDCMIFPAEHCRWHHHYTKL